MQGLTSGQDEWWSLLAIDFSSAYTEQLLCTAGAEIEFADWGWVALWAALRDWTVGWRERRGCGHPLCIPSVGTQYSHVCMLFRVQDCTRHATAFSSVLRLLCCEDVVRPGASCRARAERRDETRTVRNVCGCVTRDRPAQRYAGAACGAHALDRGTVAQRFESMNLHALASLH